MLIGGLVWGRAADIYGRRRILIVSLTLCGSFAAVSALAVNYWMFVTAIFISGAGSVLIYLWGDFFLCFFLEKTKQNK